MLYCIILYYIILYYIILYYIILYSIILYYIIIGGWGVSPTGKSDSVRLRCDACVRACGRGEAVCARETLLRRLGCGTFVCPPVCRRRVVPFWEVK